MGWMGLKRRLCWCNCDWEHLEGRMGQLYKKKAFTAVRWLLYDIWVDKSLFSLHKSSVI